MLGIILISLLLVSFLWALWSLKGLLRNTKIAHETKEQLMKGRVVFQSGVEDVPYTSSSSEASSSASTDLR